MEKKSERIKKKVRKESKYTPENIGMMVEKKKETEFGTIYWIKSAISKSFTE